MDMNAPQVSLAELREDLPNITRRLIAGDSFILTRYGMPFAALTPITHELTTTGHKDDHLSASMESDGIEAAE
jgi:antitoxin (DNA-binding transcriptional repressor) of toxin-antitoxin stability system